MSQKTLKTKRVFAWAIYNNLRNTPPKDFPTTGEIRSTINSILPALKDHASGYTDLLKKAEDLSVLVADKKLDEAASKEAVDKINVEWKEYNKAHGEEIVEILLDEESFKTLKAQFEREGWGKKWIATLEEFGQLLESFTEAGK